MPVTRECDYCGASYSRPPSDVGRFCSPSCQYSGLRKAKTTAYRKLHKPDHPLAVNGPYIPEHRLLLWDRIGPGTHPCHRCGVLVAWLPGAGTMHGALIVDHLDRDRTNNQPDNLAPSCQSCNNLNRAYAVADNEPYTVRPDGTRLRGEWRNCARCAAQFVAHSDPKRPNTGRFCSRSCARRGA